MAFELFELTGKRALITGSSQDIGSALAQGLAEHGAEIVLNGRDAAKLDTAAARLTAAGHKVSVAGFDVTQAQAAKDGVEAIEKNSGPIDIPGQQCRHAVPRAARGFSRREMGAHYGGSCCLPRCRVCSAGSSWR
jgi:enoyl-[acyl-carrier-protein] reductase (NADH)